MSSNVISTTFCRKRVPFKYSYVSVLKKIGSFCLGPYMKMSLERDRFQFWRMIIRPPFMFEWRDQELEPLYVTSSDTEK